MIIQMNATVCAAADHGGDGQQRSLAATGAGGCKKRYREQSDQEKQEV
jgi:hypothetical protein